MKKLIILILLPFLSIAQDCKLKKNEIDSFTKQKVVQTKQLSIFNEIARSIVVELNFDKIIYFDLEYYSSSVKVRSINPSNNVLFLLNDGSVISCTNIQFEEPTQVSGLMNVKDNLYKFKLEISKEDLTRINEIKIKTVRIENSDDPLDMNLKDKQTKRFYEELTCFLKEL